MFGRDEGFGMMELGLIRWRFVENEQLQQQKRNTCSSRSDAAQDQNDDRLELLRREVVEEGLHLAGGVGVVSALSCGEAFF
jgi:hypothetical protein